jgi:hypothetical protein
MIYINAHPKRLIDRSRPVSRQDGEQLFHR